MINWYVTLLIPFFVLIQKKCYDFVINSTWVRISIGFTLYQTYLALRNINGFGSIVYATNEYESKRLLYKLHQIHRKFMMTGEVPHMLGFTASFESGSKASAQLLCKEYVKIGNTKIDNTFFLSVNLITRQLRVQEVLSDRYLGALLAHQLDDKLAFVITICLVASTGCVFTEDTYRTCVEIIRDDIATEGFGSKSFGSKQITKMIYATSCLLPCSKLGAEYIEDL